MKNLICKLFQHKPANVLFKDFYDSINFEQVKNLEIFVSICQRCYKLLKTYDLPFGTLFTWNEHKL